MRELQWAESQKQGEGVVFAMTWCPLHLCARNATTCCPLTGHPDERLGFINRNTLFGSTEPSWCTSPSPLSAFPHLQVACWWSVVDLDVAVVWAGEQLSIPEPGDDSTGVSKYLTGDVHLIPFPGIDGHRALKLGSIWKKHSCEGNITKKNSWRSPANFTARTPWLRSRLMWEKEPNVGTGDSPLIQGAGGGGGLLLKDIGRSLPRTKGCPSRRVGGQADSKLHAWGSATLIHSMNEPTADSRPMIFPGCKQCLSWSQLVQPFARVHTAKCNSNSIISDWAASHALCL